MSYLLGDDETLGRSVRRIVREQVALADHGLQSSPPEAPEAGVHDARRAFKKVRSTLRLVRSGLPVATFRRENHFYRDAGRALAPLRDADVLVDAVRRLGRMGRMGRMGGPEPAPPLRALRRRVAARRRRLRCEAAVEPGGAGAIPDLEAAARRVERWRVSGPEPDVALQGLRTAYEAGARAMELAYGADGGPFFHEWRKRAKDLRYQVELLQGLWPVVQGAVAVELHRLTDLLGDANDFELLATTLRLEAGLVKGLRHPEAPVRYATLHRDRLWAEARPLGERLYGEPADVFIHRLERLWRTWRGA